MSKSRVVVYVDYQNHPNLRSLGLRHPFLTLRGCADRRPVRRVEAGTLPLLFAALTGRSGHGPVPYGPR